MKHWFLLLFISQFLDKIRKFFGDPTTENIIVRKSRENPFLFGWTNSSLVQHACRKDHIKELYDQLSSGDDRPSVRLSNALGDAVIIKAVRLNYYGSCLEEEYPVQVPGSDNNMPIIRNPIDVINITAGEFLQFKVPRVRQ